MKANELRIGNYVLDHDGFIDIVKEISEDNLWLNNYGSIHPYNCDSVPINKEWFIKLGFRWSENYNWYVHNNPYIVFKEDFTLLEKPFKIEIKLEYVHELQNIYFALTGKELSPSCN